MDQVAAVRGLTPNNRGVDVAIEAVGLPEVWEKTIQMARKGLVAPDVSTITDVEKLGVNVVRLSPAERDAFVKVTRKVYQKWTKSVGPDLVTKAEKAIAARKKT